MYTQESTKFRLERVLRYLLDERISKQHETVKYQCAHHSSQDWVLDMDTWSQLESMHQLLCQRHPMPKLPSDILDDIDAVIANQNSHSLLTSTASIQTTAVVRASPEARPVKLSCWRGDITTLTDVTAIVNAANAQLLGCFHPSHRCIDNMIHTAAGPRLRNACYSIMSEQGHPEPIGSAKVTPGFLLPASYILHTVGPQLDPQGKPSAIHRSQLTSCYKSCLDSAESLPALQGGRKVIALCCISTGLFAFPSEIAVEIAVHTVVNWCQQNPTTTITDIIFDTFLEKDQILYQQTLSSLKDSINPPIPQSTTLTKPPQPILKAKAWLNEATHLIISAGAGLSAATGLDYTSTTLFTNRFPALHAKGLRRLYDVFGYNKWENQLQKWGYYFLHLNMTRTWPLTQCDVYKSLHSLVSRFQGRYFIRTSNADGFFARNGFDPARVATPQGQYRYLQCLSKCRDDAVFEAGPLVEAALPFIDPVTQCLVDGALVPVCEFCGGEITLCVRGGNYFNDKPFGEMERKWDGFAEEVVKRGAGEEDGDSQCAQVVILELGVGLNTPGVLRWPNEDLVQKYGHQGVKLIRAGVGASGCVDWDLEEEDLAIGISGDLSVIVDALV